MSETIDSQSFRVLPAKVTPLNNDGLTSMNLVSMSLLSRDSAGLFSSLGNNNTARQQPRNALSILDELLSNDLLAPIPTTASPSVVPSTVDSMDNNNIINHNQNAFFGSILDDVLEPTPFSPHFPKTFNRGGPQPLNTSSDAAAAADNGALDRLIAKEFDLMNPTASAQPNKVKRALVETTPEPSAAISNKRVCHRLDNSVDENQTIPRFRDYQETGWMDQFNELIEFQKTHGHCLVPHTFPENPVLARWVKRQRYQYKLKKQQEKYKGKSTMTNARIEMLESIGFVWDSHAIGWGERLEELKEFQAEFGHCIVPASYKKFPSLSTWVKCQRRQNKLFWNGERSTMTQERFRALCDLGFTWELRKSRKKPKA